MATPRKSSPLRWAIMLALLGCALYLPMLGSGGLAYSEGHRVIPGHEVLDRLDEPNATPTALTTMFERPYLRKPPGTPWAIAASESAARMLPVRPAVEFAARLPSALAMMAAALIAFACARRWYGDLPAFSVGSALLLTPAFWEGARTAEIEGLHTAACAMGVFLTTHAVFARKRAAWLAGAAWALALLAKGPAGTPVMLGTLLACAFVARRETLRILPGVLLPQIALAGAGLGLFASLRGQLQEPPVLQSPGAFLWDASTALKIAGLMPTGLVYAMPAALAMLFPWGAEAREEPGDDAHIARALRIARALTLACVASLLLYTLFGVSNPRYAIPALVGVPGVVGYVAWMWRAGRLTPTRLRIARAMALGHPLVWLIVLVIGMGGYILGYEQPRRATSGREAAPAMAQAIIDAGGRTVWANEVIEARPETLWYASREASSRVRWASSERIAQALRAGDLAAVRTDAEIDERAMLETTFGLEVRVLHEGRVHKYDFALIELAR